MSDLEIGWVAGIIEGEGTINCINGKRRLNGTCARYARVGVDMTDEDVVARLRAVTGVGVLCERKSLPSNATKPVFRWQVAAQADVKGLLDTILPVLGDRRRARALDVLAEAGLL